MRLARGCPADIDVIMIVEAKTYTDLLVMEKKMYAINDLPLPFPVSLKVAGTVILTGIPWGLLMMGLGVPFLPPPGLFLWLIPPLGLGWLVNQPIFQKKTPLVFLGSLMRYYRQPKTFTRSGALEFTEEEIRMYTIVFERETDNE